MVRDDQDVRVLAGFLYEHPDGPVHFLVDRAEVVVGRWELRARLDRPRDAFDRRIIVAALVVQHAQQVGIEHRLLRRHRQHRPEVWNGEVRVDEGDQQPRGARRDGKKFTPEH